MKKSELRQLIKEIIKEEKGETAKITIKSPKFSQD